MGSSMILVSGCLVGLHCRYDGKRITNPTVLEKMASQQMVFVCPEQLGGLSTPRPSSQIVGGDGFDVLSGRARVISENGSDVTDYFLRGAEETLRYARLVGASSAIFKENSPSCGVRKIYKKNRLIDGCGVTTALLLGEHFQVRSPGELD